MDGINTIINMVTRNCFIATVDLKDAYYSVFLKFKWKENWYCFTCFPNGLGLCPRKFTKLNKVPVTSLHFENVRLSGYIDGFFTKGDSFSICEENIHKTMRLYDKLGFVINLKKSQIVPAQKIRILGFVIGSVKMIITLTEEKKQKLKISSELKNLPSGIWQKSLGLSFLVCQLQYLDLSFIVIWKMTM